jgi:hypothetical protein
LLREIHLALIFAQNVLTVCMWRKGFSLNCWTFSIIW